jgi:NADH:ubiquinone oxidoreductase subunit 5 (subunit L)/multisubunit Na+/H+ antiporter MnhA subunit
VLGVVGFVGSFLTAIYTWRMIFRAFFGEPVEPARELEGGHLYHAPEHTNPATGEVEDTDVGFPGPDHHIAEREWSMKVAMGLLAVGAIFGGLLQVPKVTHVLHTFLEPTFHESRFYEELEPSDGITWIGLAVGALLALAGIALAYRLWVKDPARPGAIRARLAGVHGFFARKWYFDELIDSVVVRPVRDLRPLRARRVRARVRQRPARRRAVGRRAGRLGRRARGAVRVPALLRRHAAGRRHRPRPLLPDRRVMTIHLSILIFFPLALATLGAFAPRRVRRSGCWPARWCRSRTRC